VEYEELPRVCEHCGEENPPGFPVCWSCHEDLGPESLPTRGDSGQDAPAEPTEEVSPSGLQRWIPVELGVVLVIAWLPYLVSGLFAYGSPPAQWDLWGGIDSILLDSGCVLLVGYLLWREGDWRAHLGLRGTRMGRELLMGIALAAVAIGAGMLSVSLAVEWGYPDWLRPMAEMPTGAAARALFPVMLLVSALTEEVLFRAYLWRRLEQITGDATVALLASALLFALVHVASPAETFSHFVFGLIFGWVFIRTRRLGRVVIAHWLMNLVISYLY